MNNTSTRFIRRRLKKFQIRIGGTLTAPSKSDTVAYHCKKYMLIMVAFVNSYTRNNDLRLSR